MEYPTKKPATSEADQENRWAKVGKRCLTHALKLLEEETAPTAATAETVRTLVSTAIAIETLNLRWEQYNSVF